MRIFKIFENKAIKEFVDGFSVGVSKDFLPTTSYIKEMFNKFNFRYFNNKLFLETPKEIKSTILGKLFPNEVDIEIKPYSGSLGDCKIIIYKHKNKEEPFLCVVEKLTINNKYFRSEKNYCEILLHEMIHFWESQVLNKGDIEGHSKEFLSKKEDIEKFGWNILVEETKENIEERGAMNIEELKENFKLLVYKRNTSIGSYLVPKKELLDITQILSYNNFLLEVYSIIEENILLDSPIFNKDISIDTLTFRLTSLKEIDSLVENNKIKLDKVIPPLEFFNESKGVDFSKTNIQYLNNGKIIVYPSYEVGEDIIATKVVIRD